MVALCSLISYDRHEMIALCNGSQVVTYRQLHDEIAALKEIFGTAGIVGCRAGICTAHQIDFAILAFALDASGMSVFLFHPQTPLEAFRSVIDSEQVTIAVTDEALPETEWSPIFMRLQHHTFRTKCYRRKQLARQGVEARTGIYFYTSGTEGLPKGVVRGRDGLINEIQILREVLQPPRGKSFLCPVPLSTSYAFTAGLLFALGSGGTLVLERPMSGRQLLEAANKYHPWMVVGVPNLYELWSRGLSGIPDLNELVLRHCVSAGSPLSPSVRERFERMWSRNISRHYGSTECGFITWEVERSSNAASVGKPLQGVRIEIVVDGEGLGEVVVHSLHLACGYVDGTALRSASKSELRDGVRTGDLGRLSENGELLILGRINDQINVHGLKVNPSEIEDLITVHPSIKDVAVVGIETKNQDQWIAACVVCSEPVADEEIRATYNRVLPPYKHPQKIIRVQAVPRTLSGKIRRSEMAQLVHAEIAHASGL